MIFRALPSSLPAWRGLLAAAAMAAAGSAYAQAPATAAAPASAASAAATAIDAPALFQQHCAVCHGEQRLGGMGPALLPESLARIKPAEALKVIQEGRPATQMQGFGATLPAEQIRALAQWIYTPVTPAPAWSEQDIAASRIETEGWRNWPAKPQWRADPMNLFVVVEGGDHHVSLVDGDRWEVIHRFPSRFALHGGPKFTPDGRYVFFGSRDGWITKYDLWNLNVVAEVRAGINMRNIAVSGDGQWVMAANYLPHTLVVLHASDLRLHKVIPAISLRGDKKSSRVSAVYDAQPRKSFVAAMKDIAEVWEISYDPHAQPVNDGLVHDFKYQEGDFKPGQFTPRRIYLDEYLDDFFFTQSYDELMGTSRDGSKGQVVNLDVRRKIADLDISGMPHLGSGITWKWKNGEGETRTVMASTNLRDGLVTVIDMEGWKKIREIKTPGPGFFMRSHEDTPYAWTDSMMSPQAKNTLTIIDKRSLEPVASVKAPPGQTLAHIEFTKDGRYALASLWEDDGALIVYDAATFKEVKRLPMKKPVGKYNVFNKVTRSEGTSH